MTGGYGHLQKKGEDKILVITQELADKWLDEDITTARVAANKQGSKLPFITQELLDILVSVNFQLGVAWNLEFKKTWAHMVAGSFLDAAYEAMDSAWYRQTPVRVKDLQQALRNADALWKQYKAV